MTNKQFILTALLILMATLILAEGRDIIVVGYDGFVHNGSLIEMNDDTLIMETGGVEKTVQLDSVAIVYFMDTYLLDRMHDMQTSQLLNQVVYTHNGKKYTVGVQNNETVVYGPDWVQISDQELVSQFTKLDNWTNTLLDNTKIEHLKGYVAIIDGAIISGQVQHTAAKIRDMAAGVAVNSILALACPPAVLKLAVDTAVDGATAALKQMLDPKTYIRQLANINLTICKANILLLTAKLEKLMAQGYQTGQRDLETCLDLINRYFMIFTLYQPSRNLLDATSASGAIDQQLDALKENLAKDITGAISPDSGILISQLEIANNLYKGFEPYNTYTGEVQRYFNELKQNMPFSSEEQTALNFLKTYTGSAYETDLSGLSSVETAQQIGDDMVPTYTNAFLEDIQTASRQITNPNAGQMILVTGGTFQRGNTRGDSEGHDDEKPVHTVHLTYDYYIGKYEVTFNEYDRYCEATGKSKPSDEGWTRHLRPIINVSWWDAIAYCNWLSEQSGLPKAYDDKGNLLDESGRITVDLRRVKGYRLPTEAEWEYAARGGQNSSGDYKYAGSDDLNEVGFYTGNSGLHGFKSAQEIGKKKPNELGLYDMSGNVWEWCHDWYGNYLPETQENPVGPVSASYRVSRGGSWYYYAQYCRVAYRYYYSPGYSYSYIGFRIARTRK